MVHLRTIAAERLLATPRSWVKKFKLLIAYCVLQLALVMEWLYYISCDTQILGFVAPVLLQYQSTRQKLLLQRRQCGHVIRSSAHAAYGHQWTSNDGELKVKAYGKMGRLLKA